MYARRGLYATQNIKAGSKITKDMVIPLRPQMEYISPAEWNDISGKKIKHPVKTGDGISKENFE
jgi:sialic acid synthase SpsE